MLYFNVGIDAIPPAIALPWSYILRFTQYVYKVVFGGINYVSKSKISGINLHYHIIFSNDLCRSHQADEQYQGIGRQGAQLGKGCEFLNTNV